jgi:hypothetical protein
LFVGGLFFATAASDDGSGGDIYCDAHTSVSHSSGGLWGWPGHSNACHRARGWHDCCNQAAFHARGYRRLVVENRVRLITTWISNRSITVYNTPCSNASFSWKFAFRFLGKRINLSGPAVAVACFNPWTLQTDASDGRSDGMQKTNPGNGTSKTKQGTSR